MTTLVTVEDYQANAQRHGLCIPRKPRHVNPRGFQHQEWYCQETGKRIRDMDGYCQGCRAWNSKEAP